jgi:hypothetical protein
MRIAMALLAFVFLGCGGDNVSRQLGARCERTEHCDDRCLTPSNDYPGGFCSLDCNSSGDCPSDAECIDKEGGVCLFACDDDPDCDFLGPDWICRAENLRADQNRQAKVCLGN